MYADPSKIRNHTIVKVRLNEAEAQLLEALVSYTGEEKAPIVRALFLEQLRTALFGDMHSQSNSFAKEGPQMARIAA
jgi:hypothetical protein